MNKLLIKSTLIGFVIGIAFFVIAPLGLGIALIAALRPVLAPGALLTQVVGMDPGNAATLVVAIVLNGLIYSLLVLGFLTLRSQSPRSE